VRILGGSGQVDKNLRVLFWGWQVARTLDTVPEISVSVYLKMNVCVGKVARHCFVVCLRSVGRIAERTKILRRPRGHVAPLGKLKACTVTAAYTKILVLSEGHIAGAEASRDVVGVSIARPGAVASVRAKEKISRRVYTDRHHWIVTGMNDPAKKLLHVCSALSVCWSNQESRYLQYRACMLQRAGWMSDWLAVCLLIHVSTSNDLSQFSSALGVQSCDKGDGLGLHDCPVGQGKH
jgi:hypothetical protein